MCEPAGKHGSYVTSAIQSLHAVEDVVSTPQLISGPGVRLDRMARTWPLSTSHLQRTAQPVNWVLVCVAITLALVPIVSAKPEPTELLPTTDPANCPSWLSEYAEFHRQNKGKPDATYLVQYCTRNFVCLGIGDRIRGMMFMLRIAHIHKKVMLIIWDQPEPISKYLLPAGIDWTLDGVPEDVLKLIDDKAETPFDVHTINKMTLLQQLVKTGKHAETFQQLKVIKMQLTMWYGTNLAGSEDKLFIRKFGRNQFGRCLYKFLFKPTEYLEQKAMEKLDKLYGSNPHPYTAWHWRIGGLVSEGILRRNDNDPKKRDLEFSKLRTIVSTLPCANELTVTAGGSPLRDKPLLLVTDHNIVRDVVAKGEFRSMIATEALVIHTNSKKLTTEAYEDAWLDMMMLAKADCLVYSSSGYSNVAIWMSETTCTRHFYTCVAGDQERFIHTPVR